MQWGRGAYNDPTISARRISRSSEIFIFLFFVDSDEVDNKNSSNGSKWHDWFDHIANADNTIIILY